MIDKDVIDKNAVKDTVSIGIQQVDGGEGEFGEQGEQGEESQVQGFEEEVEAKDISLSQDGLWLNPRNVRREHGQRRQRGQGQHSDWVWHCYGRSSYC